MPFQLPDVFRTPTKGGEHAPSTVKLYKSKLNKLAAHGYDTPLLLRTQMPGVIKKIVELTGDQDNSSTRQARRQIMCAIFWVLPDLPEKNIYRSFYRNKCMPLTNAATGEAWKPLSEYKKPL
jgi:hypothetical protein